MDKGSQGFHEQRFTRFSLKTIMKHDILTVTATNDCRFIAQVFYPERRRTPSYGVQGKDDNESVYILTAGVECVPDSTP